MPTPDQGPRADSERKADPPPPTWELPPLELRILAPPRPGPRDLRFWFGGILALLIITSIAAPYLRERPAPGALASGLPPAQAIPAALRPYYDRAVTGDASAMYSLGRMYCNGLNVPRDAQQGIHWYRLAAAAGSVDAARDLEQLGLAPEI
jgi:hypothetical protein